jgi:hypothetical protein
MKFSLRRNAQGVSKFLGYFVNNFGKTTGTIPVSYVAVKLYLKEFKRV